MSDEYEVWIDRETGDVHYRNWVVQEGVDGVYKLYVPRLEMFLSWLFVCDALDFIDQEQDKNP